MKSEAFLLESGKFDFGNGAANTVRFLGPEADYYSTHVSLIVGANGTSKSRLLSTVIEQLCELHARMVSDERCRML